MQDQWSDVMRVFEALSYVVKGMSPNGTELFFTVSYDTFRRKDTSELCGYLRKKKLAGETNISYRLNLQLQSYRAKVASSWCGKPKKSKKVRPISFYILTNGNWSAGADPKVVIKDIADFFIWADLKNGQVAIQFISFAQNATAVQRINDLGKIDFGL